MYLKSGKNIIYNDASKYSKNFKNFRERKFNNNCTLSVSGKNLYCLY